MVTFETWLIKNGFGSARYIRGWKVANINAPEITQLSSFLKRKG